MRASWRPALALVLAGCGPSPARIGDLVVTDAYAGEPIIQASGAAYVTVTNRGREADTLVSVGSPDAASATFHGGAMSHVDRVPLPPGETVRFAPGEGHLMLEDFRVKPKAGDSLTLVLEFARAGRLVLKVPVRRLFE